MPFANNQGVRIYYEIEGQGPPLVLQHGLPGTVGDWQQGGDVEGLKDEHSVLAELEREDARNSHFARPTLRSQRR